MVFVPNITFGALDGLKSLLTSMKDIINLAFPVLSGIAVIFFFWGIGQFILKDAGNDKTREEGKKKILWSIIALFVMFSIMGIIKWIGNTVGIEVKSSAGSSEPCTLGSSSDAVPCTGD